MMNRGRFLTPSPEIRRTSTVLFENVAELEASLAAMKTGDPTVSIYGTFGTPTTATLDALLLAGEGGAGVVFGRAASRPSPRRCSRSCGRAITC